MASEIIVNTIKAPTTGSNANKVIIPSGVTLDASAGTLRPSAGAVVQTVQAFTTTVTSGGSATGSYFDVGLSANITPKYASSKILVNVSMRLFTQPNCTCIVRTLRDTIGIHGITRYGLTDETGTGDGNYYVAHVLDDPATTSQITYKTQVGRGAGSNNWYAHINADKSTITLMEIAQ